MLCVLEQSIEPEIPPLLSSLPLLPDFTTRNWNGMDLFLHFLGIPFQRNSFKKLQLVNNLSEIPRQHFSWSLLGKLFCYPLFWRAFKWRTFLKQLDALKLTRLGQKWPKFKNRKLVYNHKAVALNLYSAKHNELLNKFRSQSQNSQN